MSFPSSSSGRDSESIQKSDAVTGGNWKSRIRFISNAELPLGEAVPETMSRSSKRKRIIRQEQIEEIWVYKCPLSSLQVTQALFNHQFVVFKTSLWWWSIEKNSTGITIQMSKKIENVRDWNGREARSNKIALLMNRDVAKGKRRSIRDLVKWLFSEDELRKEYHWLRENCKHFAKRVFNEFAKS